MKKLSAPAYAQVFHASASAVPAGQRGAVAKKFIQLLQRQRALKLLPRILAHLERLDDLAKKRTRVKASAPDADILPTLKKDLTSLLGPVVIDLNVDPTLRGGLVLQVGDDAIDGSLRTRLTNLHHQLTHDTHA